MENQGKTTNKNGCEMINLLNMTSSESDRSDNASPSFTTFQPNKPKRKVRFKKNFRPNSKLKSTSTSKNGNCNCSLVDCAKLFGCLLLLALVGILMWYVVSLSIRVQELQAKFTDMESSNRHDVQVKQYKKMKKRKELDALVANGKVGKRSKKGSGSCSAHELLRHDSDSSDMEDFSILQPRRNSRKKSGSRLHLTTICLPLCQFVLVSTCILVSGTLIWLHIGLREDLDLLRAHLQKVEAGSRNTPEALHSIHSKLRQLDNNVTALFHDIRKISSDIDNITSEVKLLKQTTSNLQASIASAPAIQQLPKDVHTLSESVAAFGSKITTFDSTMKEMKEAQTSYQTTTQTLSSELESLKVSVQELLNASDAVTRTSGSHSPGDVNVQKSMQETNESLSLMKKELSDFAKSVDIVRSDMNVYQSSLKEVQEAFSKNHDSIEYLENSTQQHVMRITALENLIQNNLLGRILALESQKIGEMGSSSMTPELLAIIQQNVNNSVFETLFNVLNISLVDSPNLRNQSQVMKQVHNILMLISGLLKQFSGLPDTNFLDSKNASEIMEIMLNKTLVELMEKCESKFEKKWANLYGHSELGSNFSSKPSVERIHPKEETPNTRDSSATIPTPRIQSASANPTEVGNVSVAKN